MHIQSLKIQFKKTNGSLFLEKAQLPISQILVKDNC
jgi:hypothetical protein